MGAPSPARAGLPRPLDLVWGVSTWLASSPHPEGVAGLGSLPNSVVALTAVPDLGARRFPTRTLQSGATQPAVVQFPPTDTQLAQDHRERDMSRARAVYVTHSLIKGLPAARNGAPSGIA